MNADYMRTMFDYNYWARDRILAAAAGMTEEEYAKPNGFTYDGLRSILTHSLSAEAIWASRLRGEKFEPVQEADLPTLEALTARWREEEAKLRDFLAGATDTSLAEDLVVRRSSGEERRAPVWVILSQVANHGTQHRSEAAEALTMIGRSPGNLDLLTMYWERP